MIYDDFRAARIVRDEGRLTLCEGGFGNAIARLLFGIFFLACGSLAIIAVSGSMRPVGSGLQMFAGWLVIGLFLTALGLLPVAGGLAVIGLRSEYAFFPDKRLVATTRLFGVSVRHRSYLGNEFQRVSVRWVREQGFPVSKWAIMVSCEGKSAAINIIRCLKVQRARELAEPIAGQMGLPVEYDDRIHDD
jgi:hypothetical protein